MRSTLALSTGPVLRSWMERLVKNGTALKGRLLCEKTTSPWGAFVPLLSTILTWEPLISAPARHHRPR